MGVWLSGTLRWGGIFLLLVLWYGLSCGEREEINVTSELLRNVSNLIQNNEENEDNPLCFTMNLNGLFCFWESSIQNASYNFTYTIENPTECKLRTEVASGDTWWYICEFPVSDRVCFTPINVLVFNNSDILYQKTFFMNEIVLNDPPTNLTVEETQRPWNLRLSWDVLDKSENVHEVSYSTEESGIEKYARVDRKKTEFLLTKLRPFTQYTFRVRTKADYVYKGYWSDWSKPITRETTNDMDAFYIPLIIIAVVLPILAILIAVMLWRGKLLKHKFWPEVPTPDSLFQGLFTTHKGNFKLWLGQADSYLVWVSRHLMQEDPSASLEIMSEILPTPTLPCSPTQLALKDNYVALDKNLIPHFPAWAEFPRNDVPRTINCSEDSRWEKAPMVEPMQEGFTCVEGSGTEASLEEILTAQNDFEGSSVSEPMRIRILRDESLSSDEGRHSLASSFEYTVVETCDGLLSTKPRPILPRIPLNYSYCLMSDSKKQILPTSHNYQNSPCTHPSQPIYSHC
ncbi:erythropoietin receptor [Bombina bombina]|uniref:erythropoietin receptor n=1 Tax=Bombina bombina TaxID=8345 RepID=UPI00235A6DC0|nr:erythropoietin receptor [Bombina bombina]